MPERVAAILQALAVTYPEHSTALRHRDPFQLLVAVVLSAQTTDGQVNKATPALFAAFPDARALAAARQEEVEALVRSTGYFRNKARAIRALAADLVGRFGGEVPGDLESLVSLPGVGRKTANVVLAEAFGVSQGVVVDTHVGRVSRRLGLSRQRDPTKVESDLMDLLPRGEWIGFSGRLIRLGRGPCDAKRPRCGECPLSALCPSAGAAAGIK